MAAKGRGDPGVLLLHGGEVKRKKMRTQLWLVWLSGLQTEKDCCFDSQSGHMPGLWVRYLVRGAQEADDGCFSPSLSPSLPLSLKINKILIFYLNILTFYLFIFRKRGREGERQRNITVQKRYRW